MDRTQLVKKGLRYDFGSLREEILPEGIFVETIFENTASIKFVKICLPRNKSNFRKLIL